MSNCRTRRQRPGAYRRANRNFALPHGTSRQRQISEIGAADQQHQPDSGKKNIERFAQLLPDDRVGHRIDCHAPAFVRIRVIPRDPRPDGVHLSLRLLHGDAGLQKRHGAEPVEIAGHVLRLKYQRAEDLCVCAIECAPLRKYADHCVRLAIELDGPPDDLLVGAELGLPEGMAENGNPVLARLVFIGSESAAEDSLHAEDIEPVRRHPRPAQLNGVADPGKRDGAARARSHVLKYGVLALPVEEVES